MALRALFPICTYLALSAATPFQLTIFDTTSPLNGEVLNAAGGFFLGLSQPATYCPTNQGIVCPAGNETLFAGLDALWVETPGGQQIYVEDDGAISYTIAHSSSLPPGAVVGGFYNITVASDCAADFTIFNWASSDQGTAPVTSGILACPATLSGATGPVYQVYAKTPDFNKTDCTEVLGLLPHLASNDDFGAWEYE